MQIKYTVYEVEFRHDPHIDSYYFRFIGTGRSYVPDSFDTEQGAIDHVDTLPKNRNAKYTILKEYTV